MDGGRVSARLGGASLRERLRYINQQLTTLTPERRNAWLHRYQLESARLKEKDDKPVSSDIVGRTFSYTHNEFHFNTPHKLLPLARITHLVFVPFLFQKTTATHPPSRYLDPGTERIREYFFGKHRIRGRDSIFFTLQEMFDYSEAVITPRRVIDNMREEIERSANDPNLAEVNDRIQETVRLRGESSHLSNSREFFCHLRDDFRTYFKWRRFPDAHQTFTTYDEVALPSSADATRPFAASPHQDWWLRNVIDPASGGNAFSRVALDSIPGDWARHLLGRYVQGANYLVVPIYAFLTDAKLSETPPGWPHTVRRELEQALTLGGADPAVMIRTISRLSNGIRSFDVDISDVRLVAHAVQQINLVERAKAAFDRVVRAVTKEFVERTFGISSSQSPIDSEYVGVRCMGGAAYLFSDARNNKSELPSSYGGISHLCTSSIFVDCAMNSFQRGRLIENVASFADTRLIALAASLPRLRMIELGLEQVQNLLSRAIGDDRSDLGVDAGRQTIFDDLGKFEIRPYRSGELRGREGLLKTLHWLSSCLTVFNQFVEGGVLSQVRTASYSLQEARNRLIAIGEEPLPGMQSLSEFLDRRFVGTIRRLEETGERYRDLRRRIAEAAGLIQATLQNDQYAVLNRQIAHQNGLHNSIITLTILAAFYYSYQLREANVIRQLLPLSVYVLGAFVVVATLVAAFSWNLRTSWGEIQRIWFRLSGRKRYRE